MKRILALLVIVVMIVLECAFVYAESEDVSIMCNAKYFVFEGNDNVSFDISGTKDVFSVSVTDYFGNTVFHSSVEKKDDIATVRIPDLKYGYFTLQIDNADEVPFSFAVVPKQEQRRNSENNPAAMCAMFTHSSRVHMDESEFDNFIHTIRLAGVHYVRDMMCMFETADDNGGYKEGAWERSSHYNSIMNAYAKEGIKVQFMCDGWYNGQMTDQAQYAKLGKLPADMTKAYNFSKNIASRWLGTIDNYEIGNEHDLMYNRPDKFAAYTKICAIGADSANSGISISDGGFSGKKLYINRFYANDVKDYLDVLSVHQYNVYDGRDGIYPISNNVKNKFCADNEKFGLDKKRLWLNEHDLQVAYNANATELDESQQKSQSRYVAASFVKQIANGADKVFLYKHGYTPERGYSYSSFSQDNHPYSVYSVISAFTNAIGNGEYYAEMNNMPIGTEGHIFKDGSDKVLCLWSQKNDTTVTIKTTDDFMVLTDIMGNETIVSSENGEYTLNVTPDIQYLRFRGEIENAYTLSSNYQKAYEQRNITDDKKIVLNQVFPESIENDTSSNISYSLPSDIATQITVQVYNFKDTSAECTVEADIDSGWGVSPRSQTVNVPSGQYRELKFTLTPNSGSFSEIEHALVFGGTADGKAISRSVSYIKNSSGADNISDIIPNSGLASSWKANNNISTVFAKFSGGSNEIVFDCTLRRASENESVWVCPYLSIPDGYSFDGADALAFQIKSKEAREKISVACYFTLNDGRTFSATKPILGGTTAEWQTVYFLFDELSFDGGANMNDEIDIGEISSLRLGFYGTDTKVGVDDLIEVHMRNIGVHKSANGNKSLLRAAYSGGGSLHAEFADGGKKVIGESVRFYVNNQRTDIIEDGKVYSPDYTFDMNTDYDVLLRYTDIAGKSYTESLNGLKFGETSVSATYSKSDNQATILAYDVSNISDADASTKFEFGKTPILFLGEGDFGGECKFNLKDGYSGKMILQINNGNGDMLRMLLNTSTVLPGEFKCEILQAYVSERKISVSAAKRGEATIVFTAVDKNGSELKSVSAERHTLNKGIQYIIFPKDFELTSDNRMRIYIWNSFVDMVPLSAAFE